MNTLDDVLVEWQSNLQFRQNFKKNPQQALLDANLFLSPEDFKKIQSALKSDNDKLDDIINK